MPKSDTKYERLARDAKMPAAAASLSSLVYKTAHLTLKSKLQLFLYTYICMLLLWLQIIALFFTDEAHGAWGFDLLTGYMSKGVRFLLVAPALLKLGFTAYTVINSCVAALMLLVVLAYVYVPTLVGADSDRFSAYFAFNKCLVHAMTTVLVIPVATLFSGGLACQRSTDGVYYLREFGNTQCFSAANIYNIVVGTLGLLLYALYVSVNTVLVVETRLSLKAGLAAAPSYAGFHLAAYAFVNAVLASLLNDSVRPVPHVLVYALYLPVLYSCFYRRNPYYRRSVEVTTRAMLVLLMWTVAMFGVSLAVSAELGKGTFVAWLVGVPLSVALTSVEERRPIMLLTHNYTQMNDPGVLADELNYLLKLWLRYRAHGQSAALFNGCLEVHKYSCRLRHCPIVSVPAESPDNVEEYRAMHTQLVCEDVKRYIEAVYADAIRRFETSVALRVSHIFFLTDELKNKASIAAEVEVIGKLRPDTQQRFLAHRYAELMSDVASQEEQNVLTLNVQDEMYSEAFNKHTTDAFIRSIEQSVTLHIDFWSLLTRERVDILKLRSLGAAISNLKLELERKWAKVSGLRVLNKAELMIVYGRYLTSIANDKDDGDELVTKGQQLIEIDIAKKKDLNCFEVSNDISSLMTPLIVVSGQSKQIGTIVNVNMPCCAIFGYQKRDLIGKSVNLLIPESLSQRHNQHIEAAVKARKAELMGRSRPVFGRHTSEYLVPLVLHVKGFYASKPVMVATVKAVSPPQVTAYVLVSDKGEVVGVNTGSQLLLGVGVKHIGKNSDVNAYFPGLFAGIKAYLGDEPRPLPARLCGPDVVAHLRGRALLLLVSKYAYGQPDKPTYVMQLTADEAHKDFHKTLLFDQIVPTAFEMRYSIKNKKIVARRSESEGHDDILVTESVSHSMTDKHNPYKGRQSVMGDDYGFGVKTMRLERGDMIDPKENVTEESEHNKLAKTRNQSSTSREAYITEEEHEGGDAASDNQTKIRHIRQRLKGMRVPGFVKLYVAVMHALIALVAATLVADYLLKMRSAKLVKNYARVYNMFMEQETEIQNIVASINAIAASNAASALSVNTTAALGAINFSITKSEGLDKQITGAAKSIAASDAYALLFVDSTGLSDPSNSAKTLTLVEGRRAVVTAAFSLAQSALSAISQSQASVAFVLGATFNSLKSMGRQAANALVLRIVAETSKWTFYIIVQSVMAVLGVAAISLAVDFQRKHNRHTQRVMGVFVTLTDAKIRMCLMKCEDFLYYMRTEREDNKLLTEADVKNLQALENSDGKKRVAKVHKRFDKSFALSKLAVTVLVAASLLLQAIYVSSYYMYSRSMRRVGQYAQELNATKSLQPEYAFFHNAITRAVVADSLDVSVLGSGFEAYTNSTIKQLFGVDSSMYEWRRRLYSKHGADFRNTMQQIMNSSLCGAIPGLAALATDVFSVPHADNCTAFAANQTSYSYVGSGLAVGISYYQQNMRQVALEFVKYVKSSGNYTGQSVEAGCAVPADRKYLCVLDSAIYRNAADFQVNYLQYFMDVWTGLLQSELLRYVDESVMARHLYLLLGCLAAGALAYFGFFLRPIMADVRDIRKLEGMLMMLPLEHMANSDSLRLLNID